MNTFLLSLLLIGTLTTFAHAQQLPYQTQFRQLYAYINPASVNSDYFLYEYNASLHASYRLQWSAQPQTPRTMHLSGEYLFNAAPYDNAFGLAAGAALLQDRIGPLGLTGVYARLAALMGSDPYLGAFSLGFIAGAVQYRVLHERIVWETLDDPFIPLSDVSTTQPEIGIGAYYFKRIRRGALRGDNFYLGVSVPQLWAAQVEIANAGNRVPLTRIPHLYTTCGWYRFFNAESFLELALWGKYATGARPNIHFIGRFSPIRTFWAGGGLNLNGLVHLEAGFNLPGFLWDNGALKIGYAFDYNITAFDLPFGASHEVHLSYVFDTRKR